MKGFLRRWLGISRPAPQPIHTNWGLSNSHVHTPVLDPTFYIHQIENGYVVTYSFDPTAGGAKQRHVQDLREAGEFITARSVAHQLGGK
jgi:hypothetical protein